MKSNISPELEDRQKLRNLNKLELQEDITGRFLKIVKSSNTDTESFGFNHSHLSS